MVSSQRESPTCLATRRENSIMGCFSRSTTRKVIISLYSGLVISHLKYSIQFWIPQYKKSTDTLEKRATKMLKGLEHLSWRERLGKWCLFSPEKRQLLGNLTSSHYV